MTFRTLTLKDGGKIKEKLTGTEAIAPTPTKITRKPPPGQELLVELWVEA